MKELRRMLNSDENRLGNEGDMDLARGYAGALKMTGRTVIATGDGGFRVEKIDEKRDKDKKKGKRE